MINFPVGEWLLGGLEWLWMGMYRAVPFVGIVLLINLLFRRRIAARYHYLFWLIVAARMMLPVSIESPLSMDELLRPVYESCDISLQEFSSPLMSQLAFSEYSALDQEDWWRRMPLHQGAQSLKEATPDSYLPSSDADISSNTALTYNYSANTDSVSLDQDERWILSIWLGISCALFLRGFIPSALFALRLRRCPVVTEQSTVDQVLRACDEMGVGRRPPLKEVDNLTVPAVFGIGRPTICLPSGSIAELSTGELRMILLHELAHVKRRDGLMFSLVTLIRALHWPNPMAWLVVSRIRHYMEQAADELALRRESTTSRMDYGLLLLKYAAPKSGRGNLATIGLLLTSRGRSLKRRIKMLDRNPVNRHWLARFVVGTCVILFAVAGLTDANLREPEPPRQINFPQATVSWQSLQEPEAEADAETTAAAYDITKALESIRKTVPDADGRYISSIAAIVSGQENISLEDNRMRVMATEEWHRQLRDMLRAFEESGAWQITFEVRFIEVKRDILSSLDIDWETSAIVPMLARKAEKVTQQSPIFDGGLEERIEADQFSIALQDTASASLPVLSLKISESQLKQFIGRSQSDTIRNAMFAPKVTTFNGQTAVISDETQFPFVTSVRPNPSRQGEVKPVVEVFPEGIRVHIQGTVTKDERLALNCRLMLSAIDEVEVANLPFFKNRSHPNIPVTVQVPKGRTISLQMHGLLNQGESLLIVSPRTFKPSQKTGVDMASCYLLTPRLLPLE